MSSSLRAMPQYLGVCRLAPICWVAVALAACGGGGGGSGGSEAPATTTAAPSAFAIGGSVSGLASGQQVSLKNNGADTLALSENGPFTFAAPVAQNGTYSVTVTAQPTGQTCTVSHATGAGVTASVSNVTVTCSVNTFTIGGSITGLAAGQQVTLDDNGADALTLTANGAFTFATPVAFNGSFSVTPGAQPTGQTCSVSNGAAASITANVSNVAVSCSTNTYTIGGTVTGLGAGNQVTLDNNAADPLTLTADGPFTFVTPVVFGGTFSVTVGTQPTLQHCAVTGGSGPVNAAVATVQVACGPNQRVLYTFTGGADGALPSAGLIEDSAGNLYSTAANGGGVNSDGNVFKLAPDGSGGYSQSVLYTFAAGSDGAFPVAGLTLGRAGNLYGTAEAAGSGPENGTVFQLAPNGSSYTESTLHAFSGGTDGVAPAAGLIIDSAGNLYGTTEGNNTLLGTVFRLAPNGIGGFTESVLYNFLGGSDGANPVAGLAMDSAGNLYGTTLAGGASSMGTVFKLTSNGSGGYTESVLYSFAGSSDGSEPFGGLVIDSAGNLYGTTFQGGSASLGTVFRLAPNGSGYTESLLHSFTGGTTDGANPAAGLIIDAAGNLYGTTSEGGSGANGTVFLFAPAGGGGYTETVLYNFTGPGDGANPIAGLMMDSAGNLYGTAGHGGGTGSHGVVFEVFLH